MPFLNAWAAIATKCAAGCRQLRLAIALRPCGSIKFANFMCVWVMLSRDLQVVNNHLTVKAQILALFKISSLYCVGRGKKVFGWEGAEFVAIHLYNRPFLISCHFALQDPYHHSFFWSPLTITHTIHPTPLLHCSLGQTDFQSPRASQVAARLSLTLSVACVILHPPAVLCMSVAAIFQRLADEDGHVTLAKVPFVLGLI